MERAVWPWIFAKQRRLRFQRRRGALERAKMMEFHETAPSSRLAATCVDGRNCWLEKALGYPVSSGSASRLCQYRSHPPFNISQERIHLIPLGLKEGFHQGMSGLEGTLFEKIQADILGKIVEIGFRQVHCGNLSRFIGLSILDPAQEKA